MPRFSRRSFLHLSAAASAAAVFPTLGEAQLAAAARPTAHAANAVMIDSNENPLGPCQSARDAVATCSIAAAISPRYSRNPRASIPIGSASPSAPLLRSP